MPSSIPNHIVEYFHEVYPLPMRVIAYLIRYSGALSTTLQKDIAKLMKGYKGVLHKQSYLKQSQTGGLFFYFDKHYYYFDVILYDAFYEEVPQLSLCIDCDIPLYCFGKCY